jgi:predicted ester cyclase
MSGSESSKKAVVRFVEELWNRGDFSRIDEIVAPSFIMHDPTGAGAFRGPAAVQEEFKTERSAYPGGHFQLDEIIAEGEFVACRTTYTIPVAAPAEGGPPPTQRTTLRGMNFFRVSEGRIVEEWWVYDSAEKWWTSGSP